MSNPQSSILNIEVWERTAGFPTRVAKPTMERGHSCPRGEAQIGEAIAEGCNSRARAPSGAHLLVKVLAGMYRVGNQYL